MLFVGRDPLRQIRKDIRSTLANDAIEPLGWTFVFRETLKSSDIPFILRPW